MFNSLLMFAFLFAAAPNVFVVPLSNDADAFLVDIDLDAKGDVAVLDGFRLTVYRTGKRKAPLKLMLPPDTRALDITPHPSTGSIAILAACGSEIRQFAFDGKPDGERLFEHTSYLSDGDHPYRTVMVFDRGGESLFFLPSTDAIELRTWTGELRERIEPEASGDVRRFEDVSGYSESKSRIGGADSLEFNILRSVGNEPEFIKQQWKKSSEQEIYSWSMILGELNELNSPPGEWPWFALQKDSENSARVRCALRLNPPETHIRIDTTLTDADAGGMGPARKYPGMITRLNAELPDFNGDGYTDLLLWNADRPSVSTATIARMAVQQDWPIRLTAHLFDPKTSRYTAKPFASLTVRASWDLLLSQTYDSPLHHFVVNDIDADGRTDVAFTVDSRTYVRWMMDERGPYTDETRLAEPIKRVAFEQPLDNTGRVTIGLRTESALYVLDPE